MRIARWVDGADIGEGFVDGATVVLTVPPGAPAAKVRFAWADSPTFNLFDSAGLPAVPFEMEVR